MIAQKIKILCCANKFERRYILSPIGKLFNNSNDFKRKFTKVNVLNINKFKTIKQDKEIFLKVILFYIFYKY